MSNPLLETWNTPHGVPPFDRIAPEHFLPAFETALARYTEELDAIGNNAEPPTFENTVEAFEAAGRDLARILPVLSSIGSANTNDGIREAQSTIMPRLAAFNAGVYTRADIFERLERVRASETSALTAEQQMLLENQYRNFVRAGAALDADAKARVAEIDEQLAALSTGFGQSLVRESSDYALVLESEDELAGLPDSVRAGAAATAAARGEQGKYAFTTSRSSFTPFMQYSTRRDLREKLWRAYTSQGNRDNAFDNKARVTEIVSLRAERAKLMGFDSHADFVLDDRMAARPGNVIDLLDLPFTGREEDVADQFAAWRLAESGDEASTEALLSSAYEYTILASAYEADPNDEHASDAARAVNYLCYLYGSDPEQWDQLVDDEPLTRERADQCEDEWDGLRVGWRQLLADADALRP